MMSTSLWRHIRCQLLGCVMSLLMCSCQCACPESCICDSQHSLVKCQQADLRSIPWDLPNPAGLKHLDLSDNLINTVISEIVSYTNLELLDLSNNDILTIDDDVFGALPRLRYLMLHNNKLSSVTNRTFRGLGSLVRLDLSDNDIHRLDADVVMSLMSLEELDLSRNSLEHISRGAFSGLGNLRRLLLNDNQLTSLPVSEFVFLPHLSHLSLGDNNLEILPQNAFRFLPELSHLSLKGNRLRAIEKNAFHDSLTSFVPQLEVLYLQENLLEQVPSVTLSLLTSLQEVDLSQNPIGVVEEDAFRGDSLTRLRKVSLNSMPLLEVVRDFAFTDLRSLNILEIYSNYRLHSIEPDAIVACPSLQEVDLHGNSISSLDSKLFRWDNLRKLDLRFNPWKCDCNLLWIKTALVDIHGNNTTTQHLLSQVVCKEPATVARRVLLDVADEQFVCNGPEILPKSQFDDAIMIGIFAGTACLLLLIGIVLFLKYKSSMFVSPPEHMDYQVYHNPHRNPRHRLTSSSSTTSTASNRSLRQPTRGFSNSLSLDDCQGASLAQPRPKLQRKARCVRFEDEVESGKESDTLTAADAKDSISDV